jgi:C4-dicarboxylate-specific signal transduction histidine kinase
MRFFTLLLLITPFLHAEEYMIAGYNLFLLLLIVLVLIIIMFYHQNKLKSFNQQLEEQVEVKTQELRKLNESLEEKVQEKVQELINKDKILTTQSRQAVMGEMISMIAHQWRQPLSTITLQISNYQFQQLLRANSKERAIDKTLAEISDTIIYLSETIDDFQTYFRPNRVPELSTIKEIVEKVLKLADAKIKRNNISVITRCKGDEKVSIYINELVQVILNLLSNAIDAFENLDREFKEIVIDGEIDSTKIMISIKDNASGIDEKILENIFDPYFSTKGKNGTGLGLYMSQMIIQKQFNGLIEVETSKEGTIFTATFPRM